MDKFESNIRKMYMECLFYYMHFISAVLVPFFTEWGGISFSRVLFLNSWYLFCIFVFEIPTGTVADVFGRKASMLVGSAVSVLAVLVYSSYPNFYVFLAGETLWAVAFTLKSGANEALIYDSLKIIGLEGKSKAVYSRMETFKMAGLLSGALLGGVLARYGGLRMPILSMILPFGLSGILVATLKEPPAGNRTKNIPYCEVLKSGVGFFKMSRALRILTFDMVAISSFAFLVIWFYQMLLKEAGVGIVYFGVVHAAICLAQIAVLQTFSQFEKRLGSKLRLLKITALIAGTGYIALGFSSSSWVIIPLIVVSAGFGLSRTPLYISYMNKFIPSDKRATVLSVTSMARNIGIGLANLAAAAIADWSLRLMVIVSGVLIVFFALTTRVKEEHLVG
jgi:MFS family permease